MLQVSGVLVQYPATDGSVIEYGEFAAKANAAGAKVDVPRANRTQSIAIVQLPA